MKSLNLDKAKELLKDPSNSIASIGLDCGYNDPGLFTLIGGCSSSKLTET